MNRQAALLRALSSSCLITLTLCLFYTSARLKSEEKLFVFHPTGTDSPMPAVTPSIPTPTLPPEAKIFQRQTDVRHKNWRGKIPEALELTEYLSVISIPEQKHFIFRGKELVKAYTISTGAGENKMPEGVWRVGEKRDFGLGEIYGPRLMFLEVWDRGQFVETTRAFHGTSEPERIGTNFGLGCVYHRNENILEVYDLLPPETLVVTTYDNTPADWEILIGGTVVLSRGVDERIRRYKNVNYPWEKISKLTQSAHLTIVNLKSPFVENCPYVPDKSIFCAQTDYVRGLVTAGIDLVSLAGNHLGDYGTDGIEYTLDVLSENKVLFTGAGRNANEANQPQIMELSDETSRFASSELRRTGGKSLKIGFFSFNTVAGTSPVATEATIGVAGWEEDKAEQAIKRLGRFADIIIAMPNWGPEYTHQPSAQQMEIGRQLIDWGVDIVAGDQAHWVQRCEEYQDGVIFYGLGNLVFDQMWSEETRQGLMVKIKVAADKSFTYELMPTILEDYAQPRVASESEAKDILDNLK